MRPHITLYLAAFWITALLGWSSQAFGQITVTASHGTTMPCTNAVYTYTASAAGSIYDDTDWDCGAADWSWTIDGSPSDYSLSFTGSQATVTWLVAGAHTITAHFGSCTQRFVLEGQAPSTRTYSGPLPVTAVDPVTPVITLQGTAVNVTANGATICANTSVRLVPPGGGTWQITGASITQTYWDGSVDVQPTATTTYTATRIGGSPACLTSTSASFVLTVAPPPVTPTVIGTSRLGNGSLILAVKDPQPGETYQWYDSDTGGALYNPSSNSALFQTPSLSGNATYYVTATACRQSQRVAVPVNVYRVQICSQVRSPIPPRIRYIPIEAPVALPPGGRVDLWANPTAEASYTWKRNQEVLAGQTGNYYAATTPGVYTVEISYNGQPAVSQEVVVTDALANQSVNGEALSYVNTITVLKAGVTDPSTLAQLPLAQRQQAVAYADGLGRPLQQVRVQASPTGSDVIAPVVYDATGGTPTALLPYVANLSVASGRYVPGFATAQAVFYQQGGTLAADTRPYASTIMEPSPLGRVVDQTKPGAAFLGHAATVSYQTNPAAASGTAGAVRVWNGLISSGVYAENTLNKQVLVDEDQRRTEVFMDRLGRTVLQRKVLGNQYLDTYTVYDYAGRVSYVIPPAAVNELKTSPTSLWNASDGDFINRWLYRYIYDDKGRLVYRKFPTAAAVEFVYDRFDRLILTQDGNRRAANQWYFTKYDAQSRPVVEGIYTRDASAEELQEEVDTLPLGAGEFETRTAGGYTTTATYPAVQDGVNDNRLLSVNIFDDYDLNHNGPGDYTYRSQGLGASEEPAAVGQVRGRQTISRRRIVSGNGYGDWLTTVSFYDQYGNVIQQQSNSHLAPSSTLPNVTTNVYREGGFVSQVLRTIRKQATGSYNQGEVVVRNRFAYDHAGRVTDTWQQIDLGTTLGSEVLLAHNTYNELGQLIEKNLHSRDGGAHFLQSEDFRYDLQGQLSRINNSRLDDQENDIFGMELVREQAQSGLGNQARYDGGISAIRWQVHNATATQQAMPERERSYRFVYDGVGRLTDALYAADNGTGTWQLERGPYHGAYDEKNIRYDANGNITGLQRYTQGTAAGVPELIDNLEMGYESSRTNRLQYAYDYQSDVRGFRNGTSFDYYQYDANGSVTYDPNTNRAVEYNVLNKASWQATSLGETTTDYDASGTILSRYIDASTEQKRLDYVDGLLYQTSWFPTATAGAGLVSIPTPEGRAVLLPDAPTRVVYEYHLRDHLGNLRVAFRAQRQLQERKLAWEDSEGSFNDFSDVASSRASGNSYHGSAGYVGSYAAGVSAAVPGPTTRLQVAHGEPVKISVWYHTPHGVQTQRAASPPVAPAVANALSVAVAPTLLQPSRATLDGTNGRNQQTLPGLQLSVTGLLARLWSKPTTTQQKEGVLVQPALTKNAYVAWRIYNDQNQLVSSGQEMAPVISGAWDKIRVLVTPNLANQASRNGYLEVQLLNEGSLPVYFDSLTVRHTSEQVLVSQENHYYPFGLALSGVGVNTSAVTQSSKELYNGGSEFHDELLSEQGIYSTTFRSYNPTIGRFEGIDPLADTYSSLSPYSFAYNDPINFNDPTGADPMIIINGRVANPRDIVTGQREYDGSALNYQLYQNALSGLYAPGVTNTNDLNAGGSLSFRVYDPKNGSYDPIQVNGKWYNPYYYSTITVSNYNPANLSLTGTVPVFWTPRALPYAGGAALGDGPLPIGDAVGTIIAGIAIAHDGYILSTTIPELYRKMVREIDGITKSRSSTLQGYAYEVRVNRAGTYTDVRGNQVHLNARDIWKYGETTMKQRYSRAELSTMVPGGVTQTPLFYGNQIQIKIFEKTMIYGYYFQHLSLPPGNPMFR